MTRQRPHYVYQPQASQPGLPANANPQEEVETWPMATPTINRRSASSFP